MHLSVLMLTVIFEIIIIGGVTLVLNRRSASRGDDFATASRSLPAIAIAATQALTCLGGGHIMGMPGAASGFGVAALWYQIASGIMIVLMMCVSGPWIRRLGFSNIPDMFSKMFDKRTGILISAFCCSSCFGVLTCELQGVGSVVSAITGSPIALGVLIGGVIGLLYVIFGGMEQVGWVNVFNAIFMYVGVFIAILYLNGVIDGGWVSVNEYYINNGEQWKLELFSNGETWRVYIIGTLVAGMFNQMVAGQSGQISASAKNVKTLRRAALYAVPMNTIFGAMMIALYMGTSVMPQYTSIPGSPGFQNMAMIVGELPVWLAAWVLAAFAAAMLSTVAVQLLTLATIFVQTIYCNYWKKDATPKQQTKYIRIVILVVFLLGTGMGAILPEVSAAMTWLFAWLLPGCWMFIFGIWWKCSKAAAFWSLLICGIFNCIWSFTSLPALVHLEGNNNSIGLLAVSILVYVVIAALDKNAEGPFKKKYIENRNACVADDLVK